MRSSRHSIRQSLESHGLGGVAGIFAVIATMITIAVLLTRCNRDPGHRAFEALASDELELLLGRTVANLELCRRHPDLRGLDHFCEDQAALARVLPGCDDACLALATPSDRTEGDSGRLAP